jgi:ankyrin repeat protein
MLMNSRQRVSYQLHEAVRSKNFGMVKDLVNKKSEWNINALDDRTKSPLHYAVEGGCQEIVEYLLNSNADPDLQDSEGNTPTHKAYQSGNEKIKLLLIKAGARVDIQNSRGEKPPQTSKEDFSKTNEVYMGPPQELSLGVNELLTTQSRQLVDASDQLEHSKKDLKGNTCSCVML